MKTKAKLILASAVFVAALMLLVPLAQIDMSGGGGTGNSNSDSIVLSESTETTYYVKSSDNGGNDSTGDGSQNTPFATISKALKKDNVTKIVLLSDISETVTINKNVTIDGKNNDSNFKLTGSISIAYEAGRNVTIQNLDLVSNYPNNADISKRGTGISIGSNISTAGAVTLKVENVKISEYSRALSSGSGGSKSTLDLTMNNVTIEKCTMKGVYATNFSKAAFTNCTFSGSGSTNSLEGDEANARSGSAFDLNLVTVCERISFTDCTFEENGDIGATSGAIKIKVRGGTGETDNQYSSHGSITNGVSITNCIFTDNSRDVVLGTKACPNSSDDFLVSYSGGSPIREYNFAVNNSSAIDGITFYANGNAVTIEADGDNTNTAKLSWTFKGNNYSCTYSVDDTKKLVVFGGSKNASVDSTSITMTGGTVKSIFAGGSGADASNVAGVGDDPGYSTVNKPSSNDMYSARISISNGTVTTKVVGGGIDYAYVNTALISIYGNAEVGNVTGGGNNAGVNVNTNKVGYVNIIIDGNAKVHYDYPAPNEEYVNSGGVYGGGYSFAYVNTADIIVKGNTQVDGIIGGGMNGVTEHVTITIEDSAKILRVSGVQRGIVQDITITINQSFEGTIDKIALGALSDNDDIGKNLAQFNGSSADGAIYGSVNLNIHCDELKSSISNQETTGQNTQVFLGRGLYSNYGNAAFTCDGKTYYQHYAYSSGTPTGGVSITTPIAANITVSGNVNVIAYVGDKTTNAYDPTTFIIGNDKTWTFKNGAMITPKTVLEKVTELQNNGKLIFDGANVGEDGLVLTCGGDIEIKNTTFTKKGLYISGADNVTITGCTFTNISESPISTTNANLYSNAIYLLNCKGNITIGGSGEADKNTISAADASKPMRGIYLDYCGASEKSLLIQNNEISDVNFNTVQITNASFSEINISNNTISNWDDDADSGSVIDSLYEKGRAIRITATSQLTIKLSENTFSKDYLIGKTYDTSNIIKITNRSGGSTNTTLSSNTAEISFIADSTTAYAVGLAISNEDFFGSGYESDDTKMNITVGADDENNKTKFTTKGLYIKGANDVTIQNCEFTNITEMIDSSPDAIQLVDCTGNIIITENKISNVAVKNPGKPNKGMGINIIYGAANAIGSITISDNVIENTAHNAITVQSKSDIPVANILIEDNILSNWDSDSSNNTSENNNDLYYGGRAIRLATGVHSSGTSIISENTFIKKYADPNRDDRNILKATSCSPEFKNNILVLSGIDTYDYADLFIIGSDENNMMVTFNPNGGYYYTSSEPGVLCSIVAANDTVSEPTDPSRSGSYSLNGWYDAATGGNKQTFPLIITADTTLYANWTYTGGSGGVPVTPPTNPEEPVVEKEEVNNEDGTISSITETTVTKENDDGSKETIVEKEEVVKDKDGNVQSVIEEKQSEVVNKDGSTNKTSEKVVKDKDGKVIEEKTEIEIEDKNTGVSTSVEVTKGSDGKTASEITTQTSVETKDGKAQVSSEVLNEALKQAEAAKKAAEEKGAKDAKPVIEINAENSEDFTETEISAEDLSKLAEAEVDVKIKTATGEVNIPPEVSKNLSSNADEKVSLSFGEADKQKLTEEQKKTVGDAPVFEFNLKSGEKDIHDLGGTVSVTVPYELKAGEDPNKITVWYIDEQGNPVAMNSVYDPETKSITFETSHFSYYFIAEDASIPDDNKDDSNNTIYYAVAAVIVVLIIIALAYYFMKKKQ